MATSETDTATGARARRYLVLGLGDTGLSCARHLRSRGAAFEVMDTRPEPPGLERFRREFPDVGLRLGPFDADRLRAADVVVASPGIGLDDPAVAAARGAGARICGDVELFARAATAPVAAVTGSNGKSTVTALLGAMARASGRRAGVGGNLGPPALDLLDRPEPDLYVLELSSFQLERTWSLRPAAATVLNLSPDHLDRHGTLEAYRATKRRALDGARRVVLNRDDPAVASMSDGAGACTFFSLGVPRGEDYGVLERDARRWLARGREVIAPASQVPLAGRHNLANALAALAMGDALGLERAAMLEALSTFRGLPHRCRTVTEHAGVRWIDDSKGTNVGATVAAATGLGAEAPVVLIAGGQGKGADFTPLRDALGGIARVAILFGRDAAILEHALSGAVDTVRAADLAEAVDTAARTARPGDVVLFSPACASFDMFSDFAARGRAFESAVRERVMGDAG